MAEGGEGEDEIQFLRTVSGGLASPTSALAWGRGPGPRGLRAAGSDAWTLLWAELWGGGRRDSVCKGGQAPARAGVAADHAAGGGCALTPPPRGSSVKEGSGLPALFLSAWQRVPPVPAGGWAITNRSLRWRCRDERERGEAGGLRAVRCGQPGGGRAAPAGRPRRLSTSASPRCVPTRRCVRVLQILTEQPSPA